VSRMRLAAGPAQRQALVTTFLSRSGESIDGSAGRRRRR